MVEQELEIVIVRINISYHKMHVISTTDGGRILIPRAAVEDPSSLSPALSRPQAAA
jgi:hypothetical protein